MTQGFIDFTLAHAKLATISLGTVVIAIAESASTLSPETSSAWENLTLKVCLIFAVIYLVRENTKERAMYQKNTENREDKVVDVIEKNTEMAAALLAETKRQTAFFDDISSDVVKSALRTPAPSQQH